MEVYYIKIIQAIQALRKIPAGCLNVDDEHYVEDKIDDVILFLEEAFPLISQEDKV